MTVESAVANPSAGVSILHAFRPRDALDAKEQLLIMSQIPSHSNPKSGLASADIEASESGIHVSAVHRDGLAGNEIAVGGGEKNQRPRGLPGFRRAQRARHDGKIAGGFHMTWILRS